MTTWKKFLINFKSICLLAFKIAGFLFSALSVLSIFNLWNYFNALEACQKLLIILGICLGAFVISMILILCIFKTFKIWSKGKNKAYAFYSDFTKIESKSFSKKGRIIVIPVNDTFDTLVETSGENIVNPLVSPNTLHGKWIKQYCEEQNISSEKLNERIQQDLETRKYQPIKKYSKENKTKGNLQKYGLGTTAIIDGKNNVKYYLLAISSFDENNNASTTKRHIRDSVDDLIDFYDKNGQSEPIYIPLVGTGMSRSGLSHKQSLKIIKSCILTIDKPISGEMYIVVYIGDKDKVSIFN